MKHCNSFILGTKKDASYDEGNKVHIQQAHAHLETITGMFLGVRRKPYNSE